ncbi:hypothetical protein KPH14_009810 [Odynerus spinipes]|uniref:Cell growth-regulating nucleolar protein n=1 Tax=Odynerus spinipes TaxID=1348599 RepID=A0AAD9RWB9_9HYME|nr:hypothetical protein KPH14_009810 [Odynerus spinipes]
MVVFTCNNCGETLKKPRVAKHYQFQCRSKPNLTCVDCLKDFHDQEYIQHTKCITEAERYGGKDYVPKPGACKGERKQQEWLNIVHNLLETSTDLSNSERNFLQTLSKCENIPRKKVKFMNFINSAFGFKTNKSLVESVWAKMETAYQQAIDRNGKQESVGESNGNHKREVDIKEDTSFKNNFENNVAENQNNENIYKESKCDEQNSINNSICDNKCIEELESSNKKKKSKKRKLSPSAKDIEEYPISKRGNINGLNTISTPSNEGEDESTVEITKFSWKNAILNIVSVKGEISVKKLQKKVYALYIKHYQDTGFDEKFLIKFNKKLNKMTEVIVSEQKVRLV